MSRRRSSVRPRKRILVCNDDGVYGPGLMPLARALEAVGDVTVVAPEQERSAASHAITLHKPIRVRRLARNIYIINGTPADTVRFGVLSLMEERVDLVVSGINQGANMGADTIYSGTVGAAMEGCMLGFSALAVSLAYMEKGHFDTAARFAARLAKEVLKAHLPRNIFLNVNVPDRPEARIKGVAVTRLGKRIYGKDLETRVDPRGQSYYWMAGADVPGGLTVPGSDITTVQGGKISVTPLHLDLTAHEMLPVLKGWKFFSARK